MLTLRGDRIARFHDRRRCLGATAMAAVIEAAAESEDWGDRLDAFLQQAVIEA